MAVVCLGLLVTSFVLDVFLSPVRQTTDSNLVIKTMEFFLPLFLGIVLCTGKRWTMMAGIVYGTIGLALDLATLVQSMTGETDTIGYLLVLGISGILNFLLIVLGGRGILSGPLR